jgi:hypothetical protein
LGTGFPPKPALPPAADRAVRLRQGDCDSRPVEHEVFATSRMRDGMEQKNPTFPAQFAGTQGE